jgi:RND family efflux transporter MFP subunit
MHRQALFGLAVLSGTALFLAGCGKQKPPEPAIQTVRAGVVEQTVPDTPERYSASIEPIAQVDLAFKSAGIIERIYQVRGADGRMRDVQAGDKVTADTELAQVRPMDFQQRVDQAEAQLAQSEAQLAQAKAQLTQARASFSEADIEFTRASTLFQSASLVKPQFDQAKGRYDSVAASVTGAEAAVKAAEAGIANAQAAVSQAKLSLSDTSLRAPFAGWISARNVDRGSIVSGATVGFSVMDTHLVKAVFAVPDSSLAAIRLGQHQTVVLDAPQRALQGVVTAISPQADPKVRVFSIEVTLENSSEQVRPGMIASLTLGGARNTTPRLTVPLSAVVSAPSDPNGFAVMRLIQRDGKSYAAAQKIQIGETVGNSIEVTQGLVAGQKIIALGASLVRDGQEVHVLP